MKAAAFISHYDCSRHDTGWNHPDHQGRLPGLMRAVHADMLTLFDHLLEVEGRRATGDELLLLHSAAYLDQVRSWTSEAAAKGTTIEPVEAVRVSSASWEAATAAVGCVLTGIDRVCDGDARTAFCAVRPPGRYVTADAPGQFGLLNTVATGAKYLVAKAPDFPLSVLELGGPPDSPTSRLLEGSGATVAGVYAGSLRTPTDSGSIVLPLNAGREAFLGAIEQVLEKLSRLKPRMLLLSMGFDGMQGDPLGDLDLTARDYHEATLLIRGVADRCCEGRMVSILEGGYDARSLGAATVQHLRALVGVAPID